jgi:hypothetical protein
MSRYTGSREKKPIFFQRSRHTSLWIETHSTGIKHRANRVRWVLSLVATVQMYAQTASGLEGSASKTDFEK